MDRHLKANNTKIIYIHEVTFSLNTAFVFVAFVFLYAPNSIVSPMNKLEFIFNRLFHIQETDFMRGYWEFFLPGAALALCIWILLRLTSRTALATSILRSGAGIAAIGAAPLWWVCATYLTGHLRNPFGAMQIYELTLALFCLVLFLLGRWPIPKWGSLVLIFLHYTYWMWEFWPLLLTLLRGWGGSVAVTVIVGLIASLVWILYVSDSAGAEA